MSSLIGRFRQARGGTAAIEFCFIAPVMLMLYAGITEFGSILKAYYQTNRLASQYAAAWSDCSDEDTSGTPGNCGRELANYTSTSAISNIAPALTPSAVTVQMFQFQMNGTTPNAPLYAFPSGQTMLPEQITAAKNAGIPDQSYGVLVTVNYIHTPTFFATFMGPYLNLKPSYTIVSLKS